MINLSRLRLSTSSGDVVEQSPLPLRACLLRMPLIELVDFIFLSDFDRLESCIRVVSASCRLSSSRTSLRVRRFLISRAIFSSVVPRFFGDGGGIGGRSVEGHAGRGLRLLVRLLLLGMLLVRLVLLLPVEGRSRVAKLIPESDRRSDRWYSELVGSRLSGQLIS